MAHGRQAVHHRTNHALRGRVGGDEPGVRGLQGLQLAVGAVVLGVGHGGRVLHVILVCPVVELVAQCFYFDSCLRFIHGLLGRKQVKILGHDRTTAQLKRRRASTEPADRSRWSSWS